VSFVEISLWQYTLFTRRELADKIGTSPSTRSSSASNLPSLGVAFQIAQVFGVPLEAVFRYEKLTRSTT
jgi:DNA-binding XRE family transcriptional regulator